MAMYEKGEFAGRETEVQEMMKALNDWWQDQNSDHPGTGKMTDFQVTESRLLSALEKWCKRPLSRDFSRGLNRAIGWARSLRKIWMLESRKCLNRSFRATDPTVCFEISESVTIRNKSWNEKAGPFLILPLVLLVVMSELD